jgi:hypothetical protein
VKLKCLGAAAAFVVLLILGTGPAFGASPVAKPSIRRLSNEVTFTRWAHPLENGPIYEHPSFSSRRVGRLHFETEDGFPEVYVLLRSYTIPEGEEWIQIRIPARPNGGVGWVPREDLGTFEHSRWRLVIDLATRRMHVYLGGRLLRIFPVGVGKPSTPTPPGHFWIRERYRVSSPKNAYYPYALGTADYSTLSDWPRGGVVGIHGPYFDEAAIPGDPSHGCVRMRVADIGWLGPRVALGTPVDIITGRR